MNQSRRIILNIVATYGRTLVGLFVGLFCGRWTLMALGETDFGLYGLLGGLVIVFSTLNGLFAAANARFFAVALGEAQVAGAPGQGLENCRRWFNTAVLIHVVVPTALFAIGYPLGVWLIRHWLTIPAERVVACIWVFRFSCLAGYVTMVSVPCFSMYVSKQLIAELTVYGLAQSLLHFAFVSYMVTHSGDWLTRYAAWMCAIELTPFVIYCVRAFYLFPECRVIPRYWFDWGRIRQIGQYAFWLAFASVGMLLSGQGLQFLSNKYFGTSINASMAVSNKVLAHATSLTAATGTAFQPVISSAYGRGDLARVRTFAARTTKLALVFALVFVVPLCLEMNAVLVLWLKNPPPSAAFLCTCILLSYLADKLGYGEALAVEATGRVAAYQFTYGCCQALVLGVAWALAAAGLGVKAIGIGLLVGMTLGGLVRVFFAAHRVAMPVGRWFRSLLLPVAASAFVAFAAGKSVLWLMPASALRIPLTTLAFELVFLPLVWFVLLDSYERLYLLEKISKVIHFVVPTRGNAR